MKSFAVVALFALLACVSAQVLQGPSSRATVVGPDGSAISSVAPGGTVVSNHHPGFVAHSAPIVAHTAYAAPAHFGYAHHGVIAHHGYYF